MATMDVNQLAAFVAVVRAGSFTKAAELLGTQKAHLSRSVSRLESQLGVRLLQRSTRSLAVTEVGRELFERASGILGALDETEAAIRQTQREPTGTLKLTCGTEFGLLAVNGWIAAYLQRHPRMRVEAEFSNRVVDIIHEGFDVAIRVGSLADSDLAARKLGEVRYALYASPDYLRDRPEPADPGALAKHDLIYSPSGRSGWRLFKGAEKAEIAHSPRLLVDNNLAARDLAAAGIGIALLPKFQVELLGDGRLVGILPGWERSPVPVHAVFASSRYLAPKVRAFVDHAKEGFTRSVTSFEVFGKAADAS